MCIILLSYNSTPGYQLILAANRDEFYSRPTAYLAFWDEKNILAGRDLQEGGTWLGITPSGKFGALTNYRETLVKRGLNRSRGEILRNFFSENCDCQEFIESLAHVTDRYRGFNLLIGNRDTMYYHSNRGERSIQLKPGIYGLSNHQLNSPWPKVTRGKKLLKTVLDRKDFSIDDLFKILIDTSQPDDNLLPSTGVGKEWEKILAPIFIRSENYGTRSSAIITIADNGAVEFHERTYLCGSNDLQVVSEKCFTITDTDL